MPAGARLHLVRLRGLGCSAAASACAVVAASGAVLIGSAEIAAGSVRGSCARTGSGWCAVLTFCGCSFGGLPPQLVRLLIASACCGCCPDRLGLLSSSGRCAARCGVLAAGGGSCRPCRCRGLWGVLGGSLLVLSVLARFGWCRLSRYGGIGSAGLLPLPVMISPASELCAGCAASSALGAGRPL